ncbi:DUF2177 domain-containing protein [Pelagivirga sediminicola]|uniref:DUF2177 domain-containing protein n=1 Tax=Pelagivirga sediminicola TaxID=2170575 RepID=A0A2T7G6J3_9RHOB|nr:DUF2177 family protein [Pelagivirga sediminicola]PVA10040.1 DUF2177 domain-containing protein [Pelagivirga sediminicola]
MTVLILYVVTLIAFLGIDYLGLSYLIKPTFEQHIGPLLTDSPRMGPAVIFYAFYVGVLLWFVSWPALEQGKSLAWVFGSGVLIGAMAYGTYEFTNLATLKDWTWRMVATDFTWGSLLTGVSATVGVAVARAIG